MATLEKIRSKAGLLVGVVGIALFAFIIGDFLRSGSTFFNQSKEKIAVIDGHSIDYREFQNNLETAMNNYKAQGASLTEEQQNQVRQMVFDQMVGSILLNNKSQAVGFAVGKDERADLLMGSNISPIVQQAFRNPQTGAFDKNYLMQFLQQVIENDDWSMYQPEQQRQLQQQREAWLNMEKAVAEQKLYDKFSMLIASAIVSNSLDAKASFNDNSTNVDFNYVSQLYSSIPDADIEVSDAEIAKLYESRKHNYKQEAAKVISYIAVHVVPSEADFTNTSITMEKVKEELLTTNRPADVVNENSDVAFLDAYISAAQLDNEAKNFVGHASIGDIDGPVLTGNTYQLLKLLGVKQAPDSIKVNQIYYSIDVDDADLQSHIDSLTKVIRSGKPFSEVALAESNGQFNGDMDWQTEASLVSMFDEKFANELFDAKINELITLKSTRGTHLVQITDKTKPVTKYKVGLIKKEVVPSTETTSKMYNDLNQYIAKNRQLEKFKSAAAEAGYVCQNDVQFSENQPSIAGIENSRQVIRWANSRKKGDISEIFDCQGYFVVAAVDGELKTGFRPLKQLSDILKRELINEKKGVKIVESLKAKNLGSLDDYATAMNSTVQEVKFVSFATPRITGIGIEPIVNVKALSSEAGQLTGPFAGKNAVYVLSLTTKNVSEQPYDEAQQKMQMNMQNSYKIMQALQSNRILKDKATIEDNRSRFY